MNTIRAFFSAGLLPEKVKSTHSETVRKVIQPVLKIISSISELSERPERVVRKKDCKQKKMIEESSHLSEASQPVLHRVLGSSFFKEKSGNHLAKVLGHLHGDRIIGSSPLERLPAHVGTQVVEAYLDGLSLFEKPPNGLKELQDGMAQLAETAREIHGLNKSEINAYSRKLTEKVYFLEQGKSFFISGQCSKNGLTCSVVYEFRKNASGTYDLFVYMMGNEEGSFGDLIHHETRGWMHPFMHFKGIPSKEIFFTGSKITSPQPDLFQGLLETKELNVTSKFASLGLFAHFEPYFVPSSQEMKGFMSAAKLW